MDKETAAELADMDLRDILVMPKKFGMENGNILFFYALLQPGKRFREENRLNVPLLAHINDDIEGERVSTVSVPRVIMIVF